MTRSTLDMFGAKLRMARAYRGLSMRGLADQCEVSANAIAKFEAGEMAPRSSTLLRMARSLDVSIDWLMCPCAPEFRCACVEIAKTARG